VKRREFITLLGGAAAAWPLAARAQQGERVRRIGVLMSFAANDREGHALSAAFAQGLQELGWSIGRNIRIDIHWTGGNVERIRKSVAELLALAPDVILAASSPTVGALQQATRTVPIVFVGVGDPVGGGFVESLARPGGNATGFMLFEYSISGKWLELLKRDGARRNASGRHSRSHLGRRGRAVGRNPIRGAVIRGGVEPGRCARRRRDRACHNGIRARAEWRPDRDGEPVGEVSPRADNHAGGPAPLAHGLYRPQFRQ
jgi:hypothetical protein